MQPNETDPRTFAASVRALLDEDPRRYVNFGVYWYFVKAILRRVYDRAQMPMIGAYEDPDVIARMPQGLDARELISAAIEEYAVNASLNMGRNTVSDPDGELFLLADPDMGA